MPDRKCGRRLKACIHCSRAKVHCYAPNGSSFAHCSTCKLLCSLGQGDIIRAANETAQTLGNDRQTAHADARIPISSLLNFTNDKLDVVTKQAVANEPPAPVLGPVSIVSQPCQSDIDPALSLLLDNFEWSSAPYMGTENAGSMWEGLGWCPADQVGLSARLDSFSHQLSLHAESTSALAASLNHYGFHRFFNAANIQAFASAFCSKRHYQYQILHWQTLSLEKVSLPLLLAIALTGATYSFDQV